MYKAIFDKPHNKSLKFYEAMALNKNIPTAILEEFFNKNLYKDSHDLYRALARNPNLTLPMFIKLFERGDPSIDNYLSRNPGLPKSLIKPLMDRASSNASGATVNLLENPNVPSELLEELARQNGHDYDYYLAKRPDLPLKDALRLIKYNPPALIKLLHNKKAGRLDRLVKLADTYSRLANLFQF